MFLKAPRFYYVPCFVAQCQPGAPYDKLYLGLTSMATQIPWFFDYT